MTMLLLVLFAVIGFFATSQDAPPRIPHPRRDYGSLSFPELRGQLQETDAAIARLKQWWLGRLPGGQLPPAQEDAYESELGRLRNLKRLIEYELSTRRA